MRVKKFLRSAAFLALASAAAKILGAVHKIPLMGLLGAEGSGLYQLVFPIYTVVLALAGGGVSQAVSRAAAQEEVPAVHSNQQFNQLLAFVTQHAFEPLSLEQIAAQFYLNANYCSQLFKNVTGQTFSQYVRDRRIERAKELLAKSAMPVSEIAASVGYDDSRYFARIFAGQVGVPPRKYRAERQMKQK